ncbi:hypothetical protein EVAR_8446_1 [Eumeta japonica]|uniref:Uncharacterized protein n=1 Tax=Eumeta variegata TaxID=151549 RepID=A0A4C1WBQ8_EUMVA|nr:hypothetical protein EVAR_8446_1 [Eumeta japonica]
MFYVCPDGPKVYAPRPRRPPRRPASPARASHLTLGTPSREQRWGLVLHSLGSLNVPLIVCEHFGKGIGYLENEFDNGHTGEIHYSRGRALTLFTRMIKDDLTFKVARVCARREEGGRGWTRRGAKGASADCRCRVAGRAGGRGEGRAAIDTRASAPAQPPLGIYILRIGHLFHFTSILQANTISRRSLILFSMDGDDRQQSNLPCISVEGLSSKSVGLKEKDCKTMDRVVLSQREPEYIKWRGVGAASTHIQVECHKYTGRSAI